MSPGPFTEEVDQLLIDWKAEGVSLKRQLTLLAERFGPGRYRSARVRGRRKTLGLCYQNYPWTPEIDTFISDHYGVYGTNELCGRIGSTFGIAPPTRTCLQSHVSTKLHLYVSDAHGLYTVTFGAEQLGICPKRLAHTLKRLKIKVKVYGPRRCFDPVVMPRLRELYPVLTEPMLTTPEAAKLLGKSIRQVSLDAKNGLWRPVRFGFHQWLVSRAVVEEHVRQIKLTEARAKSRERQAA